MALKPFLIVVARFAENPDHDVWMETDNTQDMTELTDRIWSGDLFHSGGLRQLSWVARVDVANGAVDDWTEQVAETLANMSHDRETRPHDDLADWLKRRGVDFYELEPDQW